MGVFVGVVIVMVVVVVGVVKEESFDLYESDVKEGVV